MKKIGILTQPLGTNYGGILQAFALQHTLREMGHEPITLNRVFPRYRKIASLGWGWANFIVGKRHKPRMWMNHQELSIVCQNTNRFIQDHISVSEEIHSTHQLKKIIKQERFDAVIVGSDQVWRKEYSPCMPNYFLDFLSGNDQVKKIAYAASFGTDEWQFNQKETEQYSLLAKEFDAIGVREDSAVEICRNHLGVEATHVLDPTMLVDKSVYEGLALSPNTYPSKGNLFCYILDRSPEKKSLVDQIAKDKSLVPFELLPEKTFAEIKSNSELIDCVLPPVEQWLRSFMDAEFVITDSFHGTVFSILFNKPFITISNKGRGQSRFNSLLCQFKLNRRLFDRDTKDEKEIYDSPINWDNINNKIEVLKLNKIIIS